MEKIEYEAYIQEMSKTIDELKNTIEYYKKQRQAVLDAAGKIISEYNILKGKVEAYENVLFGGDTNDNRTKEFN